MHTDECASKLAEQPRRITEADGIATVRQVNARFFTAAETAALLKVTEEVLRRWRGLGHGPQPVPRPEGWRYNSKAIERLAAMPRVARMLAITRLPG